MRCYTTLNHNLTEDSKCINSILQYKWNITTNSIFRKAREVDTLGLKTKKNKANLCFIKFAPMISTKTKSNHLFVKSSYCSDQSVENSSVIGSYENELLNVYKLFRNRRGNRQFTINTLLCVHRNILLIISGHFWSCMDDDVTQKLPESVFGWFSTGVKFRFNANWSEWSFGRR